MDASRAVDSYLNVDTGSVTTMNIRVEDRYKWSVRCSQTLVNMDHAVKTDIGGYRPWGADGHTMGTDIGEGELCGGD